MPCLGTLIVRHKGKKGTGAFLEPWLGRVCLELEVFDVINKEGQKHTRVVWGIDSVGQA